MKVVILAGGLGTRLSEETTNLPKPMVPIGNMPILLHIMKIYSRYGFNDFIICLGYKGYVIKEYFAHYYLHKSDVTFDFTNSDKKVIHTNNVEPWKVTLVDTGLNTLTGTRIKKIQKYIGQETFMLTYGDGLSDINLRKLLTYHDKEYRALTITASLPAGRFGSLDINSDNSVKGFVEKPKGDNNYINSGFMVVEPEFFDYINGDVMLEQEPIQNAIKDNKVTAYKHDGFFCPMDTIRDMNKLNELWNGDKAPWKVW